MVTTKCVFHDFYFHDTFSQAITALAHLRAAVLYFMDLSEQCGHTIEEQIQLFTNIKPLFVNKPIIAVMNKTDIIRPDELADENKDRLAYFKTEGRFSCSIFLGLHNFEFQLTLFFRPF